MNSLSGVLHEEVSVLKDYPDVFPEELPGMPPNRDIEFLIELLPGTGPISKRPYRMPVSVKTGGSRVGGPELCVKADGNRRQGTRCFT